MITEIKMPQLGQTSDEVRLIRWLVKMGDKVKKGQALCEVETDKTVMEMETYVEGTVLKLCAEPDSFIKTGTMVAMIGDKDDKIDEGGQTVDNTLKNDKIKTQDSLKANKTEDRVSGKKDSIKATRLVENLANKKNIDLSKVIGTGPRELITKEDLNNYERSLASSGKEEVIELSKNQAAVGVNLSRSKTEIPHFYLKREVDAEKFLKIKNSGHDISMYSALIYATAKALKQMPLLNGYFKDNKVFFRKDINICFALSVGDELYVPVIKDADKKSIIEIDKELKALSIKAGKKLEAKDLSGGTFTITNLGMFGIDEFAAIINPSQSGIFSIGKFKKVPYIDKDGKLAVKDLFTLSGSFDHRYVNGKSGAEFIDIFCRVFEENLSIK